MEFVKRAFGYTNKNMLILCALILFQCLSSVYIYISQGANPLQSFLAIILYFLMLTAFMAGFCNLVKSVVNGEDTKSRFVEGVGEYFLPVLGMFFISTIICLVATEASWLILQYKFGSLEQVVNLINSALADPAAMKSVLESASPVTLYQTNIFLLVSFSVFAVVFFQFLYWVPALYLGNKKNIFKSLWNSLKFLYKNFFKSIAVCIVLMILLFILNLLEALSMPVPVLGALFSILGYYIFTVFVFSVFIIYKDKLAQ